MTLIAGIVSRDPHVPPPAAVCQKLRDSISRNAADERRIFQDDRSLFVKIDIGAFGEPAHVVDDNGAITLVSGEPLLDVDGKGHWQSRYADTTLLHNDLVRGDGDALRFANGVFNLAHYDPAEHTLCLVADKLGLRPLYYYVSDDLVIFAGALRILEEIIEIPKILDVRAVIEMVGLGYALADRTPYIGTRMLRAGEMLRVTDTAVILEKYWRWDSVERSEATEEDLLVELYDRFRTAVARRSRDDASTAAYLSGGLDSRCIVAALRDRNVTVHTFNFSRPETQDQLLGREFGAAVGAVHTEVPKRPGDLVPDYASLMADAWITANKENGTAGERPQLLWSGEGGSVALGHVHLSEKMVALMRSGEIDDVINEHLARESAQVSPRLFRKHIAGRMSQVVNDGIRNELNDLHAPDAARNFYIHLLINDQHRKLAKHFENIDLNRLEFQLPFFDSSLLELIVSIPLDICLKHKLYVKWLPHFPSAVTEVAWQTYPGHEPCPLPVPLGLEYQWSAQYQKAEHAARKRRVDEQAKELLGPHFPTEVLDRMTLRLASWVNATGLRDYGYLIGPAHTFYHYAKRCGGRFKLPDD